MMRAREGTSKAAARARRGAARAWLAAVAMAALAVACDRSGRHLAPFGGGGRFGLPTVGLEVPGSAVLLAIDDHLLPIRHNLCYYLSKPRVRPEPVLTPSRDDPAAPDNVAAHFYGTVLHDQGRYRMWYYAVHFGKSRVPGKPTHQGPVCYAESDDGLRWTKPHLDQVEIKGSARNNAISLPDDETETVSLIKEEDEPKPERRYKMVYNVHNGKTWVLRTATSADGVRWQAAPGFAIDEFIETSSFYRFGGLYIANGQRSTRSAGGFPEGRQGRALVSVDFDTWLPGQADAFLLQEPADPAERGSRKPYDQVHLGVGAASFGNVLVGLYGMWHNEPGDETRKIPNAWFGFGKTSADLGLVVSNDGLHFREPARGYVYLSRHESAAPSPSGKAYPTILCQSGNGILNVGDETRIYHGRWLNAEYGSSYYGEIALATLPRDRWGGLGLYPRGGPSTVSSGSLWSAPIRLPAGGCRVLLNADHAIRMRVEVADAKFNLLPEFSAGRAGTTGVESGLECPVTWPGGGLGSLGGRTVRFRVELTRDGDVDPRIFAIYLRAAER